MNTQKLAPKNQIAFGLMMFAFFLGAGNWIFPPMAGYLAGQNLLVAIVGFLLTAVGLPLVALLAIAKVRGGTEALAGALPAPVRTLFSLSIYLIMVPLFGIPRTALVAYEIGFVPFLDSPNQAILAGFSIFYFAVAMFLALKPGKLIDNVGKILTPMLVALLLVIAWGVFTNPLGGGGVAVDAYVDSPFIQSFIDGYQTLDALAAIMLGIVFLNALERQGITEPKAQRSALMRGGLIAALGLSFVYVVLFYLGSSAHGVVAEASNGGAIFVQYVSALYGLPGQVILAGIITLACVTTATGGLSAFGQYCNSRFGLPYKATVIASVVCCVLIANIGLEKLLVVSLPSLFMAYPVAMALIAMNLLRERFNRPQASIRIVFFVALMFAILDGLKVAGVDMSAFSFLPLFDYGMAWILPTTAAALACYFGFKPAREAVAQNS